MKTFRSPIQRLRKVIAVVALLYPVTAPVPFQAVLGADTTAAPATSASLQPGESYGGGKVVYLFREGEKGYVPGQNHGLVAAVEDIGNGTTWAKAVKLCQDYRAGGFSDWRLPDKTELNKLYMSKSLIGGFRERHFYWSSTESDKNDAWDQSFRAGVSNLGYKLDNNYVRAVRTF